jgi:hypothetical protein
MDSVASIAFFTCLVNQVGDSARFKILKQLYRSLAGGYALDCTGYALDCTGYALDCTGYSLDCTGYSLDCTGYALDCTGSGHSPVKRYFNMAVYTPCFLKVDYFVSTSLL